MPLYLLNVDAQRLPAGYRQDAKSAKKRENREERILRKRKAHAIMRTRSVPAAAHDLGLLYKLRC